MKYLLFLIMFARIRQSYSTLVTNSTSANMFHHKEKEVPTLNPSNTTAMNDNADNLTSASLSGNNRTSLQLNVLRENIRESTEANSLTQPREQQFHKLSNIGELDEMERRVTKSISNYIRNPSDMKLAKTALKNTTEYIEFLNNSLQALPIGYNLSDNKTNLKLIYETRFRNMTKRFKMLNIIQRIAAQYFDVKNLTKIQGILMQKYNNLTDLDSLEESCIVTKRIVATLEDQIVQVQTLNNLTGPGKMEKLFSRNTIESFRKEKQWESYLEKYQNHSSVCEDKVQEEQLTYHMKYYVLPTIQGIIFIIGFVGNVILLLIFLKTKVLRIGPNVMVLNLAIADCLHLLLNIPMFYAYFTSSKWEAGIELCTAFRFLKAMCKFVSAYAVVAISLQKLMVLKNFFDSYTSCRFLSKKFKDIGFILYVWVFACLLSVPHVIKVGIYKGNCYGADLTDIEYSRLISLFDLFMLCIIPGIIILVSSGLSSTHLKKSIRQIPGESVGHDRVKRAREVSSNILIALTVVFLISYSPFTIYATVAAWWRGTVERRVHLVISIVFYNVMFFNSCFNPIALYIVSHKYRNYFKRYILCRNQNRKLSEFNSRSTRTYTTKI